jgi:hypothetical protein
MNEDGIPRVYSNLVEAQFGEEGETGQRRTTVTVRLSGRFHVFSLSIASLIASESEETGPAL